MTIGERIKKRREELKMTQEELALKLGYASRSSLNKIESNERNLTQSKIKAIAEALYTTPGYIMGWDDEEEPTNAIKTTGVIPIAGRIAAGAPKLVLEDIIEWVPTIMPDPDEYFGLVVCGDSMINAGIPNGSYAIIHKQSYADEGQIVACMLNGEEATLKRFRTQGENVILMPENSAYSPIVINKADFGNGYALILGVLKKVMINY